MPHPITNALLPNDLVFDIGANAGDKTQHFLDRGARVIAVEPQPAMVEVLRGRFRDNANVIIVPKGVASAPGNLTMNIDADHPVLSSFKVDWKEARFKERADWSETILVEVTTLDRLIAEYGVPRYLKVDVEGFEAEVVKGLSTRAAPISLEFVAEGLAETEEACQHLEKIGYRSYNMSFGNNDVFVFPEWVDYTNIIARLKAHAIDDPLLWGDVYAT